MTEKTLHIVNGDSLAEQMQELNLQGQIVVWRELLCEGPTRKEINANFFKIRKKFLLNTYNISPDHYEESFVKEVKKLKALTDYDRVVLWFEFDLFCHINMLAVINLLSEKKNKVPVLLVCSKKLKGEKEFQPLCHLSSVELKNHFKHSISLTEEDLEIASHIWELYCGDNPSKLKTQIKTKSNFEYLSSCLRAHVERFPNSVTGINSLEKNVLRLVENYDIKSMHHLMGYALQYQGYYGYSDSQMQRLINKLAIFIEEKDGKIILTEKGEQAVNGTKNFYRDLKNEEFLGGVKNFDFLYESESHRLLKL